MSRDFAQELDSSKTNLAGILREISGSNSSEASVLTGTYEHNITCLYFFV